VKPSNVLVADGGHVYLADFGLTRRLGEAGASLGVGQSLGTVDYVAPEQIRGGEVDGRADLYSLGCLLCECVSGEPPFVRPSEAAVLFAHLEEEPRAPAGLEQVLGKALAKDPEERFQSGRELVEAARSALGLEPRRARWPLGAVTAGLLLIGAALLAFFLTGSETSAATTGRAVRIDPGADRVAKTIAVGNDPSAIAAGSGSLWISNFDDGSVSKVDPATNRVQTLTVNGTPISIAVSEGVVFVVNGPPANTLTLIKAAAGNAYDIVPLERGPSLGSGILAADAGSVWLADKQTRKILKIDPAGASPRIVARTALPYTPSAGAEVNGLAVGEGAVWVIGNTDDRRLWRLDPATGRIEAAIRLPIAPRRVAAGLGGVWITGEIEDVVLRLNPDTGHIAARIPAGRGASGVAVGSGSVWVANSFDGTVSRIDPVTNRVVRTMKVGPDPADLVASSAGVWVTTRAR
jgi:YVTN family beta-propeller protein